MRKYTIPIDTIGFEFDVIFLYLGVSQNFARKYTIPIDTIGFEFDVIFLYLGVSQNFARKYTIPIDTIGFEFDVMKEEKEESTKPEDGAYVHVRTLCLGHTVKS